MTAQKVQFYEASLPVGKIYNLNKCMSLINIHLYVTLYVVYTIKTINPIIADKRNVNITGVQVNS